MSTEYISRDYAVENMENFQWDTEHDKNAAIHLVRELVPAADVRPVVHGRWIPMTYIRELIENGWPICRWEKAIKPDGVDGLMCSECGEIFDVADARNFCPQCGADMRGAKNV